MTTASVGPRSPAMTRPPATIRAELQRPRLEAGERRHINPSSHGGDRRHEKSRLGQTRAEAVGNHTPQQGSDAADQHDDAVLRPAWSGARP